MKIVVLCHLYYQNLWEEIRDYLKRLDIHELYFNIVDTEQEIIGDVINSFPNAKILVSPNQGKDCGGNLRLIREWIKNGANGDLIFQCHGKSKNRKELFEAILNQDHIISLFRNPKIGMVGSKKSWVCETWNGAIDEHKQYCRRFGFNETRPMTYIQGTIFVVRAKIYKDFFSKLNVVEFANELEQGNVQEPSNTHAWERLFATIVEEQGYRVVPTRGFLPML